MKPLTRLTVFGSGIERMTSTLSSSGLIPFLFMTNPRYLVSIVMNRHFGNFPFNPCLLNWLNTDWRCWRCSLMLLEKTSISSRYAIENCSNPPSHMDIRCWKIPGALVNPKGITRNWKSPEWHANAAFSWSTCSSATCQYPDLKSRVKKQVA